MKEARHSLKRLYPWLGLFFLAMGIAFSSKVGWFAGLTMAGITLIAVFAILFFIGRSVALGGQQAARRILVLGSIGLVIFWPCKAVLLILK